MNDWLEYKKMVVSKLDDHDSDMKELKQLVRDLHSDLIEIKTAIKVRQSILSFAAASIGAIVTLVFEWFTRGNK